MRRDFSSGQYERSSRDLCKRTHAPGSHSTIGFLCDGPGRACEDSGNQPPLPASSRQAHRRAAVPQEFRGDLQNLHDAHAVDAARQGPLAPFDAIEEVLALEFERLALAQMRTVTVAVVVGMLKLGEGVVWGGTSTLLS